MGINYQCDDRSGDDGSRPDDRWGLRGAKPQLPPPTEAVWPGLRRRDPARTRLERHTAPLSDEPLRPTAKSGTGN